VAWRSYWERQPLFTFLSLSKFLPTNSLLILDPHIRRDLTLNRPSKPKIPLHYFNDAFRMSLMSKNFVLITTLLFAFLSLPSIIIAEEVDSVTDETNALEIEIKGQPNRLEKSTKLQEMTQQKEAKQEELQIKQTERLATQATRAERFETMQRERETKFEEIKLRQQENLQQREDLKVKFTELKLQRLELIKQNTNLVSARYTKVSEKVLEMLGKINNALLEKRNSGFDV